MPDWKKLLRGQLADLNLAAPREAEIVEEMAQHAEDRYRELLSCGASEAEARRIALREISDRESLAGGLGAVERTNAPEPVVWNGGFLRDVRYGVRSLRKTPAWTLLVIAVLAIGIGANVAIFTVVDAAFLRPLDYPEPERLVQMQESPRSGGSMPVAYPNFLDWEKQARSFDAMGIGASYEETLKRAGGNERIRVGYVSPGFHRAYGVKPVLGRAIAPADDTPGAQPVIVLSHRYWQTHFAGSPDALGQTLTIDGRAWTIAGVLGPFLWQRDTDVFAPAAFTVDKYGWGMRENRSRNGVIARLKPGVSVEQARTEMNVIAARLAKQYPGANGGVSAAVTPLREYVGGGVRQPALLMFGAVALLLLIACANVAGLLLARAAVRQREIAIRMALGAGRFALIRQLLTESLMLALAGAAAGVAVAHLSLAGIERIFPAAQNLGGIAIDARVLAFAALAAAVTAVLFGLAPALQLTQPGLVEAIKAGGRGARGGALRARMRKALVVSQVALAVVLSIGAGLLMRSLLAALQTNPGFRPERIVIAEVMPPDNKDMDIARNSQFLREVVERLESAPGVQAAGASDSLPFRNPDNWGQFYRDDRPLPEPGRLPNAAKSTVTPGYFRAMGIPLLRGRLFNAADGRMPPLKRDMASLLAYIRSAELTTVINQTMARRFWPGEDPIGKSFRFGPPSLKGPRVRIVGVVADNRQFRLERPVEPQYFFSADQFPLFGSVCLTVRTTEDAAGLAGTIRGIVAERERDAIVTEVESMQAVIDGTLAGRERNVALLGLFAGVALLLAALGLYATMAYVVAQRTQEIGVRMALGAAASDVRKMVVREGALLAGVGVAIGLAAALAAARVVASMLYGVTATDALTYAGSALLLAAIMLVASYIPARRASRVDPLDALRAE
jgi:predicted permease